MVNAVLEIVGYCWNLPTAKVSRRILVGLASRLLLDASARYVGGF